MNGLAGKKCVVSAAAQGIGRASAEMLAEEDAHVIATDINRFGGHSIFTDRLPVLPLKPLLRRRPSPVTVCTT